MGIANTVEATLRSRYVDGITAGIQRTQQAISSMLSFSVGLFENFSAAVTGGMDSATNAMVNFGRNVVQHGQEANSTLSRTGLIVTGVAIIAVGWFARMGAAAASWAVQATKSASETLELKLIYEGLAEAAGEDAAEGLDKLRRATEGLIANQVLLKNSNRVLQADIPISLDLYTKLVDNVFKLAKASGADATTAQNMLTDAIIKGNTRGFQAIGVNLQIKDAINELALAQGISTNKIDSDAKMRSFYLELLAKTSEAVARNRTDYFSLADAIEKTGRNQELWIDGVGEGIGRSRVFSEMLKRYSDLLDQLAPKQESINDLALTANRWLLALVAGYRELVTVAVLVVSPFELIWNIGRAVFSALFSLVVIVIGAVVSLGAAVLKVADAFLQLANINWISGAAGQLDDWGRALVQTGKDLGSDVGKALGQAFEFETSRRLVKHAESVEKLRLELEKYTGSTVKGTGGARGLGDANAAAAVEMKKLKEESRSFYDLMSQLNGQLGSPERKNFQALLDTYRKIDEFRHLSERQIVEARTAAMLIYRQAEEKLAMERRDRQLQTMTEADQIQAELDKSQAENAKRLALEYTETLRVQSGEVAREQQALFDAVLDSARKKRQEEQQRAISEAVATANTISRAVQLSKEGKIDAGIGVEAIGQSPRALAELKRQMAELQKLPITNGQVDEVIKLKQAIEDLNNINLTGFERAMKAAGDFVKEFTKGTVNAFSSLMSDLVTGQEDAGKKFLGALLGMVADGIMIWAKYLIAVSIAKFALGDFAGGFKAAAAAALVAATAGVVRGIASNVAQTSQSAGAAGSFQTTAPRPIGGTTQQIINVGAPGRGQSTGEARETQEVTVRVEVPDGFIARAVERNVKGNGKLRTVIAQYQPA